MNNQTKTISINTIGDQMIKRKETVAVAESVTAGQLQFLFSGLPQAEEFFQGGITVYNLGQKTRQLNIDPIHAQSCNSVSEKIAIEMASNVATRFVSDWGIGITGYASPVPELDIKLLYAYYAVVYKGQAMEFSCINSIKATPSEVQRDYAEFIMERFAELIIV
jgi:nicotinamide-nucleotide amidase